MFWKQLKYKDLIITVVAIVMFSAIGLKLIDNFPFFLGIVKKILSLSTPFFYGLIIAYILNPLVKFIMKIGKMKTGIAILLTYSLLIGVMALIGVYFVPNVIESTLEIAKSIPEYITEVQIEVYDFINREEIKEIITTGPFDGISEIISKFGSMVIIALEDSVTQILSISSQVVKFIVGVLISVYVLIDKDRFINVSKRVTFIILKPKKAEKVIEVVRIYHKMIGTYIGIKAIDSAIIGVLAFILLKIFKSEYATVLAVVVGITNMIPYFGPFVGEIIGFLINVFVSPVKGITIFLVLLALQLFDGWYLDPKLIGDKVGVRPFFIILGVVIGGGFYGPIGMLLASPTVATIKIYFVRILERNKELTDIADKA